MAMSGHLRRSYVEISKFIRSASSIAGRTHLTYQRSSNLATACRRKGIVYARVRPYSSAVDRSPSKDEIIRKFQHSLSFPSSTHEIKDLSDATPGETVLLHGYLGARADLSKKLTFAQLLSKDLRSSVQIISSPGTTEEQNKRHSLIKSLNGLSPVAIKGTLKDRKPPKDQPKSDVERILNVEVQLEQIHVLNEFPKDIIVTDETIFPPEQRHMQLKTDSGLRHALAFRAKAAELCRETLAGQGFTEVETPLLFKSTPEGAREFLVPTRAKGAAYALPQSPQQYKQILMASGIPKYYQIARCFRDEDLRADRQPEFTQLDLEMAFANGEDVMVTIEKIVSRLWKELLGVELSAEAHSSGPKPVFRKMSYEEAMSKYGIDKPDLRRGMEIRRIGHLLPVDLISKIGPLPDPIVDVMKLHVSDDPAITRKFVTEFMDSPAATPFISNPDGQPGIFVYDERKPLQGLTAFGFEAAERAEEELSLEEGDLVVIQARKNAPFAGGSTPMGNLRLALHKAAVAAGLVEPPKGFEFLWITDFPLFSPINDTDPGQGGSAGICSTHHPFTSPKTPEDVDLLLTDPLKVKAEHYDIVVNGVELGGGSRRIHDADMQEFVLREVLKMKDERVEDFRHLLEVLRAGCPPHAGIALGFDRLIAVMLGKDSVRDVIAFPKSGKGEDLLVKSPNQVTPEQLQTYHLKLVK